jgi:hypothetical protein
VNLLGLTIVGLLRKDVRVMHAKSRVLVQVFLLFLAQIVSLNNINLLRFTQLLFALREYETSLILVRGLTVLANRAHWLRGADIVLHTAAGRQHFVHLHFKQSTLRILSVLLDLRILQQWRLLVLDLFGEHFFLGLPPLLRLRWIILRRHPSCIPEHRVVLLFSLFRVGLVF